MSDKRNYSTEGTLHISEDHYIFAAVVPDGEETWEAEKLPEWLADLGIDGKRVRVTVEVLDDATPERTMS